jgi:hypothetical protein
MIRVPGIFITTYSHKDFISSHKFIEVPHDSLPLSSALLHDEVQILELYSDLLL